MKNVLSFSEFVNETIDIVSMLDTGTSNFGKGETTKKLKDIEAILTDPNEWTDDISFRDKFGNVYFIDDLIDKTVKIGNKTITVIEDGMNEKRISFRGKTTNDLYKIIKNDPGSMVFANGNHYSILDPEEMRHDLKNDSTFVYDEDGGEHEIKVSDIEFLEIE